MEKILNATRLQLRLALAVFAFSLCSAARGEAGPAGDKAYEIIALQADSLPSLNMARTGHATFCLDGELTVLGGHAEGFIPTPTAEYFRDGEWRTVPLVYPHDHAIALPLRSGKVLLAGGHQDALGIGQLFSAEIYDPVTHSISSFGCLDRKRAFANGIELAEGQVAIAGNWYADDGIEMFADVYDPSRPNAARVKDVSIARAKPYMLRIADDDAIIFGSLGKMAEPVESGIVDRLKGPTYREPFLDAWRPLPSTEVQRTLNHFVGNEAEGRYHWLLPVQDVQSGRVAIARVEGPSQEGGNASFSLLPTEQQVPDSINGAPIIYSSLVCDRERGLAYLIGEDGEHSIIVIAIPYDAPGPAPLTIYMTEPVPISARTSSPVLMPGGDLVFAGGHLYNNFSPSAAVIRLPLGSDTFEDAAESKDWPLWLWAVAAGFAACAIAAYRLVGRKHSASGPEAAAEEEPLDKNISKDEMLADLCKRIERLMDDEQLYLNPNLRVSDVAARVGSNTAYVSAAINSQFGCSFTQFLMGRRIAYAQQLMLRDPEGKISDVSTLSGFSTDSTFFRAFRSTTGMSPKEWIAANAGGEQP